MLIHWISWDASRQNSAAQTNQATCRRIVFFQSTKRYNNEACVSICDGRKAAMWRSVRVSVTQDLRAIAVLLITIPRKRLVQTSILCGFKVLAQPWVLILIANKTRQRLQNCHQGHYLLVHLAVGPARCSVEYLIMIMITAAVNLIISTI
jgi:hypothetical protein